MAVANVNNKVTKNKRANFFMGVSFLASWVVRCYSETHAMRFLWRIDSMFENRTIAGSALTAEQFLLVASVVGIPTTKEPEPRLTSPPVVSEAVCVRADNNELPSSSENRRTGA